MSIDVRRAGDRMATRTSWLDSRHSFSYGSHYDPANTHFGLLLCSNEDVLDPGAGFDEHPHRDVEVVTWVLSGVLAHADSAGHRGEVRPGFLQWMSAGRGVRHAERSVGTDPAHYVQMWVRPGEPGGEPGYEMRDLTGDLPAGGLVPVRSAAAPDATLHVARLPPGGTGTLPNAPYVHVFVAGGALDLAGAGMLRPGDAARLTAAGQVRLSAPGGAEVLAWEMRTGLPVG